MGDQISGLGDIIAEKLWGKGGSVDKPNGGMVGGMNDFKDSVDKAGNEAASAFPEIGKAIKDFYDAHYEKLSSTREQAEKLDDALTELKTNYTEGIDIEVDVKVDDTSELDALEARLNAMKNTNINVGINATGGNKTDYQGDNGLYSGGYNYNEATQYMRSMGANELADTILGENDFIEKVRSGDPNYKKYIYGRDFGEQGSGSYASYLYDQIAKVDSVQQEQAVEEMEASRLEQGGSKAEWSTYEAAVNEINRLEYDMSAGKPQDDINKTGEHYDGLLTEEKFYANENKWYEKYLPEIQSGTSNLTAYEMYLRDWFKDERYKQAYYTNEQSVFVNAKSIGMTHFNDEMGYWRGDNGNLYGFESLKNAISEKRVRAYDSNGDTLHLERIKKPSDIKYIRIATNASLTPVQGSNGSIPMRPKNQPTLANSYLSSFSKETGNLSTALQYRDYKFSAHGDASHLHVGDEHKAIYLKDVNTGLYFMAVGRYGHGSDYIDSDVTELVKLLKENNDTSKMGTKNGNLKMLKGFEGTRLWEFFDTGGYTGSWGPEGKLAVLHQKELILNAMDTENILSAVSLVRDIRSQLDRNAAAMSSSLSSFVSPPAIHKYEGDILQQDVHITAEFPSVTNHNEIEIALSNF